MLEMLRAHPRVTWSVAATVVALILFLSTPQTDISGSRHAYATDVGEIQNTFSCRERLFLSARRLSAELSQEPNVVRTLTRPDHESSGSHIN